MTYRVSYIDSTLALADAQSLDAAPRIEEFPTEPAALARARELFDDFNCDQIEVWESPGDTLRGVRLQLKLGLSEE